MAEIAANLQVLAERWSVAGSGERANLQMYVIELCDALLIERPRPRGSGYEFELAINAITVAGAESKNFIDCWKAEHFALEGKDDSLDRRGKAANESLLRRAYGQVRNYVHHVPGATPPPYLMVLDVGATLIVWDRWAGTYGGFEAGRRIDLPTLHDRPDDIALLRDVWENPGARDRRGAAQAVTTEIAGRLAELAAALEARGHDQEVVARFLMRVVFSCFAEDIGLLPSESFRQTVTDAGLRGSPSEFSAAVEGLWRLMDTGGRVGPMRFLRFNGHFFKDATALPLTREELVLLEAAARADWTEVEPAIFGTLLTRALNPEERHRLGAEFTPPAYIERLVRPTIEEPVLERWTAVQAEVVQLLATEKPKDRDRAAASLRDFHAWMRGLRVLDPACGSGNFLYVAMHALKRIELEVLRSIDRVTGTTALRMEEIGPWQFYGIEVKPWAREIAELTLWIGFHQFWKQHHDVQPPEPILRDTGTLECRDAVLVWNALRHVPGRDRPDPTPRIPHQVSGELVPDPMRRLEYVEHVDARQAPWPEADFIIGNPPYVGAARQRDAFGDGYVTALRRAYPDVPDSADLVMYWWARAADAVASGRTMRAGLITTKALTQTQNRRVIETASLMGARVCWAIAEHPWSDGDGAEVRVAMTVIAKNPPSARLLTVPRTRYARGEVPILSDTRVPRLNGDLSAAADIATAASIPMHANAGVCSNGYKPHGTGFLLPDDEAQMLLASVPNASEVLRPYRNGQDLTTRPRNVWIIDFGFLSEEDARERHPLLFDRVRTRVKPERDANARAVYRTYWWRFGEPRREWRAAVAGLSAYIATVKTAKFRFFTRLPASVAPDDKLTCIASDDTFVLGVLSSAIHEVWARAAGSVHGIAGTPQYDKGRCFDSFPFPTASSEQRTAIGEAARRLDAHRLEASARSARATITAMYNAMAAWREGRALTLAEREVFDTAACGVLADLHARLDALVAEAYGWSWPEPDALILERLVVLHGARVLEEQAGRVHWLRPDFQQRHLVSSTAVVPTLPLAMADTQSAATDQGLPWPSDAVGQITAVRSTVATQPATVEQIARAFTGARRDLLIRHLETLELLGEVFRGKEGLYCLASGALSVA